MKLLEIKYLGQSGFILKDQNISLLIDPGSSLRNNIKVDYVYITHKHSDHTGGKRLITYFNQNLNSKLITHQQVVDSYPQLKERTIIISEGEEIIRNSWNFRFYSLPHGLMKKITNIGIYITTPLIKFGHVGDAIYFKEFSTLELDTLALPMSGVFTASPNRLLNELYKFKKLPMIILMHWLLRNPHKLCKKLQKQFSGIKCIVPIKNELISVNH